MATKKAGGTAAQKSAKLGKVLDQSSPKELAAMLSNLYKGKTDAVPGVQLSDFEAGHLAAELTTYLKLNRDGRPRITTGKHHRVPTKVYV